ncbi:MAG TPA: trypsin-like peptidase domain-containing protein [Micromonosporaceae bacterium]|nr:trypsin-like peptidase domain-containing protein [Micromonosporaceae bacterium]
MSSYQDPNQPATDATTWWAMSPAPSDPAGAGSAGSSSSAGYGGDAGAARPAAILPPNAVASLPHADERVPHPAAQRPRPRRVRRLMVAGVAAVVLAAGGGIAGAAGMHALDHGYATTTATGAPVQSVANATSIADVVAAVDQEVVSITVQGQQVADEGSGVVVSSDGLILTNNHVIAAAQSGGTIQVTFTNGKTVNASIVKADANEDLALIQASGVSGLHAATFGNSDNLQIGDTVIAIGNELGLSNSVSAGIVSALHRQVSVGGDNSGGLGRAAQTGTTYNDAIQTDASTNQGDSGGALFNVSGQVVGINSAIATASDGGTGSVGIGFAISSNTAAKFIASAAHT